jgi:hypothetical protein
MTRYAYAASEDIAVALQKLGINPLSFAPYSEGDFIPYGVNDIKHHRFSVFDNSIDQSTTPLFKEWREAIQKSLYPWHNTVENMAVKLSQSEEELMKLASKAQGFRSAIISLEDLLKLKIFAPETEVKIRNLDDKIRNWPIPLSTDGAKLYYHTLLKSPAGLNVYDFHQIAVAQVFVKLSQNFEKFSPDSYPVRRLLNQLEIELSKGDPRGQAALEDFARAHGFERTPSASPALKTTGVA